MAEFLPREGETPAAFVDRVFQAGVSGMEIVLLLRSEFGLDHGEAKQLLLREGAFWEDFFREHAQGICERGGGSVCGQTLH